MGPASQKITTTLLVARNAEVAMNYYASLLEQSKIVSITRSGANGGGTEGTMMQAIFSLQGQEFMCIDSPIEHDFTFTRAMSLFVACDSEGQKFGWVQNRFGVSWRLNLANK